MLPAIVEAIDVKHEADSKPAPFKNQPRKVRHPLSPQRFKGLPPAGTAGYTNSTVAATATTYDALSRAKTITDAGGGTATFTYSSTSNDVLIAIGPIPTGSSESLKQRQLEYDSLGRLTSVCEITTTLPGNGTCAQNTATPPTGYWTKYSYDALGGLLTVTQNAQASSGNQQTRAFAYDAMGRLASEINPETNQSAVAYTYDTVSSGTCAGTYSGDLVKRVDAIGNITCYTYDSLHRPLSRTYTVTSPTVATPNKCFVYDAAIDSNTVTNTKARLAEAYTTTSACSQTTLPSNMSTDIAFGYSARGEVTDAYELTPHSGGTGAPYNHTTAQSWASGAPNTLGGPGLPTLTYSVDAEGRTSTVSDGSGHGPVTSTAYNLYNTPPQQKVTFGSNDSDVFSFDPNTFRLTKYQFNIGSQTVTGAVNWNTNGSLGSLNISDPFSSANTQNCNYTADDLARISKTDCGTIWGQNFTYDPFGNIQKNAITGDGGTTFAPCYQASPSITNRISFVGGTGSNCTGGTAPTYDANGNSLNDTFRSFTWDAENRPITIGSVSLTYDALGRMVEQGLNGTNTEIVYTPLGGKLSLMNGTSLIMAFVPLTGGDTAVYNSSGLSYYRHTDHLGSSRFASTTSQTPYSDTAYSPFGEPYASSGTIDNSFTGQTQDTLPGLYDFMYREHDPNQGRWTSTDPAGLAAVDPTNPQTWNRYAYVVNNPLSFVDPTGLFLIGPDGGCDFFYDCGGGGDGYCPPEFETCDPSGGGGIGPGGGGGGAGRGGGGAPPGPTPLPGPPINVGSPIDDPGFGGGPIWSEQIPIGVAPINRFFIIQNLLSGTTPVGYDPATQIWLFRVDVWGLPWGGNTSGGMPRTGSGKHGWPQVNEAARRALRNWAIGEGLAAGAGCVVGGLVAAGATVATDTFPLAGVTIPAGCVGGGLIGAGEALPLVTLGMAVEFSIDAWGFWRH